MDNSQTSFYVTGGTLKRNAPSYVQRQADHDLYDGLTAGRFCYVLTSRQMGKSSLMVRTATKLREESVAVVVLDLTAIGQNVTVEQWYDGLLTRVGQQLHLEDELEEFWFKNERLGALQRWMRAIEKVVLPRYTGRVVIFIDEIDAVRSLPFPTDEFFAGIREFYNRRSEDADLNRLTFCLLGVATPSDLIKDVRTTPFNIGQRIELTDFSVEEAAPLAQGLGHSDGFGLVERILHWTGGHPYLTQRLCLAVAQDGAVNRASGVDRICEALFLSARARESDDNLLFVRERILRSEADRATLLDLYQQVRTHKKRVPDDEKNPHVSILRLSGVTRVTEGYLYVRNRIYYRVFDREWITANMPDAELRRQRTAYRRGLWRAAAIAAGIIALMGLLSLYAFTQKREADKQRDRAEGNAQKLEAALVEAKRQGDFARIKGSEASLEAMRAEQQRSEAEKQKKIADEKSQQAIQEQQVAEQQRTEAVKQKKIADEKSQQAIQEQLVAEQQRAEAVKQRQQAIVALDEKNVAEERRTEAEQERLRTLRLLYAVHMNQAQQAWQDGNIGRVRKVLEQYGSAEISNCLRTDPQDVRGFEWCYLWRLSHSELSTLSLKQPGKTYLDALSRDGKRIAVVSREGGVTDFAYARTEKYVIKVSDMATRQEAATFSFKLVSLAETRHHATKREDSALLEINAGISAVAISPDGTKLVTGHDDDTLKWWDVATGKQLMTLSNHRSRPEPLVSAPRLEIAPYITTLAFSPDGKVVASGSTTKKLILWDVASQKQLKSISQSESSGADFGIASIAFSPDGGFLVAGNYDHSVKLWEIVKGSGNELSLKESAVLSGHEGEVTALAFSRNGEILATGSSDKTVKLWDLTKHQRFGPSFTGHSKQITFISFSPDGKTFATASADKTVRVWAVPGAKRQVGKNTEPSRIDPQLSSRRDWIQNASYAFESAAVSETFQGLSSSVLFAQPAILPEIKSEDFQRATHPIPIAVLQGHEDSVLSVKFSLDGKTLITIAADGAIKTWASETKSDWTNTGEYDATVFALAYSPDGKILATGTNKRTLPTLKFWDVSTGKELSTIAAGTVMNVAFSPNGRVLASAGEGIKLWNVATGQEIGDFGEPTKFSYAVAFSPDGGILATGDEDGSVILWDPNTRQRLRALQGHTEGVTALAFSPDSKLLATVSRDTTTRLWETISGRELAVLKGHTNQVLAAAFSPDGKILATGAADHEVKLWDVSTHQQLETLEAQEKPITHIAFSPDGKRLATASGDSTVRLWDVSSRQEVASLKGHTDTVWVVVFSPDGKTIATGSEDQTVKLWRSSTEPGNVFR